MHTNMLWFPAKRKEHDALVVSNSKEDVRTYVRTSSEPAGLLASMDLLNITHKKNTKAKANTNTTAPFLLLFF